MSLTINIEQLSSETRKKISDELEIKLENKYGIGQPRYIHPYTLEGDNLKLPFAYAATTIKVPRPKRDNFPDMDTEFVGELRPEQKVVRKEALEILSKTGSVVCSAYCGFGKCLQINTPIIMYDGTIKYVQDIKVGDVVMGDDSTPREIFTTCTGEEQMYNVVPKKGDVFGCNESHILSLKNSSDIIDISVRDYMTLSSTAKNQLKLYRVGVEFPEKKLDLDPYLFGLWLGTNGESITTTDESIIEYMKKYCKDNNFILTRRIISRDKYYISDRTKGGGNRFLDILNKYSVFDNKHIPHIYKCNSRNNRLKLLAGLLDADGYITKNCYKIIQKQEQLAKDICYLARSLGFAAHVKGTEIGSYFLVNIDGNNLETIPNLIPRKKASPNFSKIKNPLVSDFTLVPTEDKRYYGFTIGGNHRYLLGDFTVTHNTIGAINLATKINFKTLIIVNKIVLIKQWKESIMNFCPTAKVQSVTATSKKEDKNFYIINAQNTEKMGKTFFSDIGTVIVDECFPYETPIRTECGWKYIGDINANDKVISFNEKSKTFESQRVVSVQSKANDREIVIVSFYSGTRSIVCTDNHRFLTTKGYVEASKLKDKDLIISYSNNFICTDMIYVLNKDQRQVFIGSFLGDGNIQTLTHTGRYRLNNTHGYVHENYCKWKADMFQEKVEYNEKYGVYKFTTRFFDLDDELYSKKSSECPQWVIDEMDERALAVWYMDNGHIEKGGFKITLFTCSFLTESVLRIIKRMKEMGLVGEMYNSYYIRFDDTSSLNFLKLIHPYVYYDNGNYKHDYEYVWSNKFEDYFFLKVKDIEVCNKQVDVVYDIEVENNHNFIVCNKNDDIVELNGPVVHNCHMIMAETLSKCLQYVSPRYLIGLSATPYRPDGLDGLLDLYFGKNKIIRKLYREHIVYKVSTGFKPPVEKTIQGRINWGSILDAQANNEQRNNLIIKIIQKFNDRNFLVLVKRVEQGKYLSEKLNELGESVTDLIGSNQEFNKTARILIGTCQKVGVGFDHSKLNTLLLATDLEEYFVQYLGRVFRTKDGDPIIFDLVDNNSILNKHYNTRRGVYKEHGGTVKEFDMSMLD